MNFIKTSFYSAISTTVSLIVKLITNKIVAVYLSTSGMFLLGQLKDFLKITNVISNFGTLNGTVTYTARYKEDKGELKNVLSTSFKIHLYFSLFVFAVTIVFNKWLSHYLFSTTEYSSFLIVLAFSLVSISIHTLFMSILNGLKQIKLYVTINIIATVLSAAVLIVLIMKLNIIGALYAIAIGQILTMFISLLLILLYKPFALKLLFSKFSSSYFKELSKFSLMALAGPICLISATFFVRYFLASEFDKNHAGSWEGMWRISAIYLLFLTTTFKFYLLPTFSSLSGTALKKEVFKVWKFMFPIIIIIAIGVYLLKDFVINILLDKEFFLVGTLIGFHLLGDTVKINGWVLGNILIAKAKTKAFIFFQIEWALVFAILTYVFVKSYGFVGVSIAYFIAYLIHFILMNLYFRNLLWKKEKAI
ncbi:MAG: O-antigen translocase [Bacteroidia bacterium]|nr:O-antigen translocase [Bacteroidia bacterium]NND51460.1 O-antigen translocase [Flavobacteriaceae bacterium]